jgi:hypothetical protein
MHPQTIPHSSRTQPISARDAHSPAQSAVQPIQAHPEPHAPLVNDRISRHSNELSGVYQRVAAHLATANETLSAHKLPQIRLPISPEASPERPQRSLNRLLVPSKVTNFQYEFCQKSPSGGSGMLKIRRADAKYVIDAFRALMKTEPIAADYLYFLQSDPLRTYSIYINHDQITAFDAEESAIDWDPHTMVHSLKTGERYSPATNLLHVIALLVTDPTAHSISAKAAERHTNALLASRSLALDEVKLTVNTVDSVRPRYTWLRNRDPFVVMPTDSFHGYIVGHTAEKRSYAKAPLLSLRLTNDQALQTPNAILQIPIEETHTVFRGETAFRDLHIRHVSQLIAALERHKIGVTISLDHEGFFKCVVDQATPPKQIIRQHNFAWKPRPSPLRNSNVPE